jgi:hypothetical protein
VLRVNRTILAFGVALAVASGCGVEVAVCAKRAECAADPPGPDFRRICEINYAGNLRSLRANREEVCQVLATARVAFDACKSELDCGDFNEADLGGNCRVEFDDLQEASLNAEDECLVID